MTQDLGMFVRAVAFAAERHQAQRRKDAQATPYINHPISLALVLAHEGGILEPTVLCAAVLHDTIEDTETQPEEIEQHFGPAVLSIVLEVSDDKSLQKEERKQLQIEHASRLSREARLVKLADKICNLRDILNSPPNWPRDRKLAYFDWARQVVDGMRGTHQELEALFDTLHARHPELK